MNKTEVKSKKCNYELFFGVGKRKTSCARLYIKKNGIGNIIVNNVIFDKYFYLKTCSLFMLNIFKLVEYETNKFDIYVTVNGGGLKSQLSSVGFAFVKAFLSYISVCEPSLFYKNKKKLKKIGLVSRDTRIVERKKFGFRKARKKKQYSKR